MSRWEYDLIVIGSGFGGAVCALRAAEAGLRVAVLERGRRMTPRTYEDIAAGTAPLFHGPRAGGLLELHRLKGLLALTASGLGGGSIVYTAVTIRPPREVFDRGWPTGVTFEALARHYERVEAMIAPTPVPDALPRTTALERIGSQMRAAVSRPPLSMDWPNDTARLHDSRATDGVYPEVAMWLRGGGAARKRTLGRTYLPRAESFGARLLPLHEVDVITPEAGGYRVDGRVFDGGEWRTVTLGAPRVVVAAGALGTVRLLLRCRDRRRSLPNLSAALGRRFYTNGDFGGLLVGPNLDLAPDAGPPVTAWIDLWARDRMFLMETGLVPYDFGSFAGLLNPARWFGGMRLSPAKEPTWSFGIMGYDDNPGRLMLGRRGALAHRHDPGGGAGYLARALTVLRQVAAMTDGRLLLPPAALMRRWPITVHPLGGAAMADSPDHGVTDPFGEVFGHPGLYVADGSLLPVPTGAPPSMTIAAIAEHVAEHLIRSS
ncbi:MAG: GMC oxidoreductase [Phycisphaerae bacterium]